MTTIQDLRFAFRTLRKSPGFTLVAIAALALGIGANSAIFSVVRSVLAPLPYEDGDRVVLVWEDDTAKGGVPRRPSTPATYLDWREQNPSFEDLAALRNLSMVMTDMDEPVAPLTHHVTANYFDLLGVEPIRGRTFREGEDAAGRDGVVVLSYAFWQRMLGGREDVLGETLELDGRDYEVVGVVGQRFYTAHLFAAQPELWVPMVLDGMTTDRRTRNVIVYGRLRPGVEIAEAQAAMDLVAERVAAQNPGTQEGWGVRLVAVDDDLVGPLRPTFAILLAAVGCVLLVACANVANLFLARASERRREIALRTALGASRPRLVRQLLTESVLLALAGGVLGLGLAGAATTPLLRLIPTNLRIPYLDQVDLDGGVLFFTFAVSFVTGIVFGLAPSRQIERGDLVTQLKEGGRSATSGSGRRRLRQTLVVAEVALAVVLLVSAGLLARTFAGVKGFEHGFDPENVLTFRNALERGSTQQQWVAHYDDLRAQVAAVPGVESVSGVEFLPPLFPAPSVELQLSGVPAEPGAEPNAVRRVVLPGYFETMRIALRRGRSFGESDRADSEPVAIVNEAFAERYFGAGSALGEILTVQNGRGVARRIVGVVASVRSSITATATSASSGKMDPAPRPVVYLPHGQRPARIMALAVRATGDPLELAQAVERTVWRLPLTVNVFVPNTLERRVWQTYWQTDFATRLVSLFALLALVLGAGGIYAVISYSVVQRTQEIGVRMALGARREDVLRLVVGEGLRLAAVGVAGGVVAALAVTRLLAAQLYGVSATDPSTFAGVVAVLVAVAAAAGLVPAWRASRVDPVSAIREE